MAMIYVRDPETGEFIQVGGSANIDTTLTKAGAAADAKATGDRFVKLDQEITKLTKDNISYEAFVFTLEDGTTVTKNIAVRGDA